MITQVGDFVVKECLVVKMVRKWRRFFAGCLLLALAVQLAVYYALTKSFRIDEEAISSLTLPLSSRERVLRTFLRLSQANSVPIFSMDRRIFDNIAHNGSSMDFCSYFCQGGVTTFATFNELFQNQNNFLQDLVDAKFKFASTSQLDPRLEALGVPVNLTTHYVAMKDDFVIHLAIFFHHEGNFWWHGRLKFDFDPSKYFFTRNSLTSKNFTFGYFDGAYEKFATRELTVGGTRLYFPLDLLKFVKQMDQSRFIPCNRTRARLFHELHGRDQSPLATDFKVTARRLIALTKQTLDKIGVPFWLSSGTCLGYFRQCDIFPHGKDVDIGIFIKDYNRLIVKSLTLAGMKLKHKLGKVEDSLELSFIFDGIKLDIFFFYEEGNHMWNGGLQVKSGKKFKYVFPKFTMCWTEFLSLKVRVPCETQQYVEANYGLDWFRPLMQWDWKSSPSNVRENGQWPKEEWPRVIQQFEV